MNAVGIVSGATPQCSIDGVAGRLTRRYGTRDICVECGAEADRRNRIDTDKLQRHRSFSAVSRLCRYPVAGATIDLTFLAG